MTLSQLNVTISADTREAERALAKAGIAAELAELRMQRDRHPVRWWLKHRAPRLRSWNMVTMYEPGSPWAPKWGRCLELWWGKWGEPRLQLYVSYEPRNKSWGKLGYRGAERWQGYLWLKGLLIELNVMRSLLP